jgi:transposase
VGGDRVDRREDRVFGETLRNWVRQADCDKGRLPGLIADERQRLKQLEREIFELRRANEILKKAST